MKMIKRCWIQCIGGESQLFLDAKILEVKETGFLRSNCGKNNESEREKSNVLSSTQSVENKLTKSLLVHEWLSRLVALKYTLNKVL